MRERFQALRERTPSIREQRRHVRESLPLSTSKKVRQRFPQNEVDRYIK